MSPLRRRFGDLALLGTVANSRRKEWWRKSALYRFWRRLLPSPNTAQALAPGEVVISYPNRIWHDGRADAAMAAIERATDRFGRRWQVAFRQVPSTEKRKLRGVSRSYVCLAGPPGLEEDMIRAVRVAAWQYGLEYGRSGVLMTRSSLLRTEAEPDPPGEIEFTKDYYAAKQMIGGNEIVADGVKILLVDVDRPHKLSLDEDVRKRVHIVNPSNRKIEDGHATVLTAILCDIATEAEIFALSIGGDAKVTDWSLLNMLLRDFRDIDLVVASLSTTEGSTSQTGEDRRSVLDSVLRQRRYLPLRPPIFFPTGNRRSDEKVSTLALPARFESAIAIGAVEIEGDPPIATRSVGSRFGEKAGNDTSAWWVAPGGGFDDTPTVALATMGGKPQAGTSLANAMAAGVAAGVIGRLRAEERPPNSAFDAAVDELRASLRLTAGAEESLKLLEALRVRHRGAVTFDRLTSELQVREGALAEYKALEHGRGMLYFK